MSDKYFKNKAEEIHDKIRSARVENKKLTKADIEYIIYIGLKEVARDQREACKIAYRNENLSKYCCNTYMEGIILSARMEEE